MDYVIAFKSGQARPSDMLDRLSHFVQQARLGWFDVKYARERMNSSIWVGPSRAKPLEVQLALENMNHPEQLDIDREVAERAVLMCWMDDRFVQVWPMPAATARTR